MPDEPSRSPLATASAEEIADSFRALSRMAQSGAGEAAEALDRFFAEAHALHLRPVVRPADDSSNRPE